MRYIIFLFIGVIMVGCFSSKGLSVEVAGVDTFPYSSVKIYFLPWNVYTPIRLTPEDVRERRVFYMEINDEFRINEIMAIVSQKAFENFESNVKPDIRMVIDAYKKDGSIETFYAYKSHIFNHDFTQYQKNNKEFLNKICSFFFLGLEDCKTTSPNSLD